MEDPEKHLGLALVPMGPAREQLNLLGKPIEAQAITSESCGDDEDRPWHKEANDQLVMRMPTL